jgi:hypothetical protein
MSELNVETVRAAVRDELAEFGVKNIEAKKGRWDWLRHPMIVTIVGFALTTGLLAAFQHRVDSKSQIREETRQALLLLDEFTLLMNRRSNEILLISSAVRRDSRGELKLRKQRYDDYYREWNNSYQAWNRRTIENMGVSDGFDKDPFYGIVEEKIGASLFEPLDDCVTKAYDVAFLGKDDKDAGGCEKRFIHHDPQGNKPWRKYVKNKVDSYKECILALNGFGRRRIKAYADKRLSILNSPSSLFGLMSDRVEPATIQEGWIEDLNKKCTEETRS